MSAPGPPDRGGKRGLFIAALHRYVGAVSAEAIDRAILDRVDVRRLERIAVESGRVDRWHRAFAAVESGATSPAEVRRALGVAAPPGRIGAAE